MAGDTTPGSSGSKPTRDMEPTEFTAENLSKHNKAPLINSLLKTKAKETALSEKQTEIHNIITAVIKSLKNATLMCRASRGGQVYALAGCRDLNCFNCFLRGDR